MPAGGGGRARQEQKKKKKKKKKKRKGGGGSRKEMYTFIFLLPLLSSEAAIEADAAGLNVVLLSLRTRS
jgi:hypothetical protein